MKVKIKNKFNKIFSDLKLDIDYAGEIRLDLINYQKSKNSIANLILELEKKKNTLNIKKLNFTEEKNIIEIQGIKLENNNFSSFKNIAVKTKNNNFSIKKDKIIIIKGSKFDATNLAKFLNNKKSENRLRNINSEIEIDFKDIKVPMSENLRNFKLIGEIKKEISQKFHQKEILVEIIFRYLYEKRQKYR